MRAPHHTGNAPIQSDEHGRQETRSAVLRVRIEPTLLARAKRRAEEAAPPYHRHNQRGTLSDHVRALIIADLESE